MMTRILACVIAGLLIAACVPEDQDETPIIGATAVEAQRTQCERRGGTFGAGGASGTLVCYTTPADAGDACARESDCSSLCLARTRTCAPVTPLFGCNDILDDQGRTLTLCID